MVSIVFATTFRRSRQRLLNGNNVEKEQDDEK